MTAEAAGRALDAAALAATLVGADGAGLAALAAAAGLLDGGAAMLPPQALSTATEAAPAVNFRNSRRFGCVISRAIMPDPASKRFQASPAIYDALA